MRPRSGWSASLWVHHAPCAPRERATAMRRPTPCASLLPGVSAMPKGWSLAMLCSPYTWSVCHAHARNRYGSLVPEWRG
eukprot:23212-Chlamydomonas_euryale.AAC.1